MEIFDDDEETEDTGLSQTTVQDIQAWMERMDQTIGSIDSRLDAVENRLSEEGFEGPSIGADDGGGGEEERTVIQIESDRADEQLENRITGLAKKLREERERIDALERELEGTTREPDPQGEVPQGLDEDLEELRATVRELEGLEGEVEKLQGKMGELRNEVEILPDRVRVQKEEDAGASAPMAQDQLQELDERLHRLERRKKPSVQVGKVEIPFEFSGIVGGVIALGIGIALYLGRISEGTFENPYVFAGVGLLLIASTLVKALLVSRREEEAKSEARRGV